jgi:hypothetical protein
MFPWLHCGRKPVKKPKYLLQSYLHYVSPEVPTAELEKSKRTDSQEKEI